MEEYLDKNKSHYEKKYDNYSIKNILYWLNNLDNFLKTSTSTEASWFALYMFDFDKKLKGKKVLEMGCGDCVNAAVMAALGAEVYANDIADASGIIISKINENYNFEHPIKFISGDFLKNELEADSFDFVVGKAFLHHLSIPLEREFLRETARLLKPDGEARFFEPAVNNKILDEVRWLIPVKNRPSKLQVTSFKEWKENDPHPDRTFSSAHFEKAGEEFFGVTRIQTIGTLERFNKFIRPGEKRNRFKRWALQKELRLPYLLNRSFSRSQLIIYQSPTK